MQGENKDFMNYSLEKNPQLMDYLKGRRRKPVQDNILRICKVITSFWNAWDRDSFDVN